MMSYQTWSQRTFWMVLVGALLIGVVISPKGTTSEIADQNVQVLASQAVKEARQEAQATGLEQLKQLDTIDQKLFTLSAEVIDAQSQALHIAGTVMSSIDTLSESDVNAATEIVREQMQRIKTATSQIEELQAQRNELLAK